MPQGTATLNFGAIGSVGNFITLDITGQTGILATALVEAWLRREGTTDHPLDDIIVDPINVWAGNIDAGGAKFTIYGLMPYGNAYGQYKVDWVWAQL